MKKLWAILLGTGAGLFAMGGVLYGVAVAAGADGYQTQLGGLTVSATRSGFHIGGAGVGMMGITEDWDDFLDDDDWDDRHTVLPENSGTPGETGKEGYAFLAGEHGKQEIPAGQVRSVVSDLETSDLKIVSGNSLRLEWEDMQEQSPVSWKLEDGTLYFVQEKADESLLDSLLRMDDGPELKLVLPEGLETPPELSLSSEYGDIELQNVQVSQMDAKLGTGDLDVERCMIAGFQGIIGTGDLDMEQCTVDGAIVFESGTGEASLENVAAAGASMTLGLGDLEVSGKITGEVTAVTGTGDISIRLDGDPTQYSYELKSGLGSLRLNQETVSSPYEQANGSSPYLYVETGMGDVRVDIQ